MPRGLPGYYKRARYSCAPDHAARRAPRRAMATKEGASLKGEDGHSRAQRQAPCRNCRVYAKQALKRRFWGREGALRHAGDPTTLV